MSSAIAVVGAGPGLGRAIARRFGSAGHPVALISRNRGKLEAIAASLRGEGIDALHTQREHAQFLVSDKQAPCILVVKKNQPSLYAQVKNLPWRHIPAGDKQRDRGHGREEHRTLQAATVAAGLAFPDAAQAIRVTRRIRPVSGGKWRTVTVYAITSLTASQAAPAQLAG